MHSGCSRRKPTPEAGGISGLHGTAPQRSRPRARFRGPPGDAEECSRGFPVSTGARNVKSPSRLYIPGKASSIMPPAALFNWKPTTSLFELNFM